MQSIFIETQILIFSNQKILDSFSLVIRIGGGGGAIDRETFLDKHHFKRF